MHATPVKLFCIFPQMIQFKQGLSSKLGTKETSIAVAFTSKVHDFSLNLFFAITLHINFCVNLFCDNLSCPDHSCSGKTGVQSFKSTRKLSPRREEKITATLNATLRWKFIVLRKSKDDFFFFFPLAWMWRR